MKSELKIDYNNSEILKELIQKTYFEGGQMGTLKGKKNSISVKTSDDVLHTILKGLDNSTIKILNEELIDGSFRFIVEEKNEEINLYPISIYCITLEDGRYSFY
jgi:hypothetical protein